METTTTQMIRDLAPRPGTLRDSGLSQPFAVDLISKHLAEAGVLDLATLSERLALAGSLVEDLLSSLRAEGRVEVLGAQAGNPFLRFGLTERGRIAAANALARDGYVGPAPVTIPDYRRVVRAQTVRLYPLTRESVHRAFSDMVIRPELLDRLGPAVNSGRPIFIHGAPGTGKSYVGRRLSRLLGPPILVPHSILFGESVVRCFDPGVHRPAEQALAGQSLMLNQGFDPRYVLCERPVLIAGGELTLDMLDLAFDPATRLYQAPLQLRANNGLLLIDDLGRQRLPAAALFNRWIIPLEEGQDHLSVKSGQHFVVPFDLVLIFATNFNPIELADEAFLRRIGYKVRFGACSREDYAAIFQQECAKKDIPYNPRWVAFLVDKLHARHGVPLLACHPRDLLGLAIDYAQYTSEPVDEEALDWAWSTYFVSEVERPTS